MRLIKTLGLAVVGAIAAMALLGTGTAAAETVLCNENVEPCPAAHQYGAGTPFKMEGEWVEQNKTSPAEGVAGGSVMEGELTLARGNQVEGKITSVTSPNLHNKATGEACEQILLQLPWQIHIEVTTHPNGRMWVERFTSTSGQPGYEVKGGGCPAFSQFCIWKVKETQEVLQTGEKLAAEQAGQGHVTGGNPATAQTGTPTAQTIQLKGSFPCPQVDLTAAWTMVSPKPLYVQTPA